MERRTALAIATATAGTILAAGAAFAANVGLLEGDATPVGELDTSPVATTDDTTPVDPTVVTVIVEDPPLPTDGATATDPAATLPGDDSSYADDGTYDDSDDDAYDDDSDEDESHDDDSYDDDSHEDESHDDDDD